MNYFRASVFLFFTILCRPELQKAQSHNLFAGIGTSYSSVVNGRTAGTALTPYVYAKYGMHEGAWGMDIYQGSLFGKIFGIQANYKYYCWFNTKTIRFFADGTIQYHKFAAGDGPAVPYKFSPRDTAENVYSLVRNKSFVNVYGAGLDMRLSKALGVQFTVSAGFNYCNTEYSPTNTAQYSLNVYPAGSKVKPVAFGRLSAYYRIYTKEKRSQE